MDYYQDSFQKFLSISDSIAEKIVSGIIPHGKPFMSRSEICEKYNISLKTAHKVQQELCRRGLISANRGKAFTVCDPADRGVVPLREICLLRQKQLFYTDYVMDELADGIRSICSQKWIEFSEIYLDLQDKNYEKINAAGGIESGQGIVLLPYRSIMCRGAGYFLKYWQPYRVTVDFPLPGTSGVMMDELDMIKSVFEHARQAGISSVMQLPHASPSWNQLFSGQSFRYGELLAPVYGIENHIVVDPEIKDVCVRINDVRPDALLFHSKKSVAPVLEELKYSPEIYVVCRGAGDDNSAAQIPGLHRYTFDYRHMGIAAAELLLKPHRKYNKRELVFVKGVLR